MSTNSRYYEILGLPPNASPRRIKEQYRKLAKTYHPDRLTDPAKKVHFEEKFKEISEAYKALSQVVKKTNLTPKDRKLEFLYERGKRLLDDNQFSQAMVIFNEILAINSIYRETRTLLQEARRKHKQLSTLYAEADALFLQKKLAEAVTNFELVLRDSPNFRDTAEKLKRARREQLTANFVKQY